jgi:outer membrane protein insertion porin family
VLIRFVTIISLYCLILNSAIAEQKNIKGQNLNSSKSTITSIVIEGNTRVEKATIENYISLHKGSLYNQNAADESVKKLFATGLFSNINITQRNNDLIVKVIENPMINKISFEGNRRIKKDSLLSEMTLKPRIVYSKTNLQKDVNKIIEMYNKSGRYAVSVDPKIIELEHNRINLVFEINEGPKTNIKNIYFTGNKKFTDGKLKKIINTKEKKWYNFFSSNDSYDADRIEYDRELLRRFYNAEGYADFKVISATSDLSPDRAAFIITYVIDEGERYRYGKIDIDTTLKNTNISELKSKIANVPGDYYNIDKIEDTVDDLTKALNDQGFAFVNIEPEFTRHTNENLIDIKFIIEEGRKAYLNRINIVGNLRTKDKVIRREFRIAEGDPFNATLIDRSEQRIKNLDFFEKVEVNKTLSNEYPDKVDINVEVQEKSTAKFNIAGGITTEDKKITPIGQISLIEDNFLGTGRQVGVMLQGARKRMDIELSLTDPYFMDKEIEAGIDLFRLSSDRRRSNPYQSLTVGGALRSGYEINEYLRHSQRYTIKKDRISDIEKDVSDIIKDQEGKYSTSSLGHTLYYDRTNSHVRPTKGYSLKFDQEVAGLGGQAKFLRHEVNTRYYLPIKGDDVIFSLAGNFGYISGAGGKKIRINERFFIGDIGTYGLRGFQTGGIGPRAVNTKAKYGAGDALGGNLFYTGTAAVNFPLGLPNELDISGSFFTDVGSLQKIDLASKYLPKRDHVLEDKSLRASVGLGFVWVSRLGPIRIDFAVPVLKKKYDKKQYWHIDFSTSF